LPNKGETGPCESQKGSKLEGRGKVLIHEKQSWRERYAAGERKGHKAEGRCVYNKRRRAVLFEENITARGREESMPRGVTKKGVGSSHHRERGEKDLNQLIQEKYNNEGGDLRGGTTSVSRRWRGGVTKSFKNQHRKREGKLGNNLHERNLDP